MVEINKKLISELLDKASANPRFRQNYDLRTPQEDGEQRMRLSIIIPIAMRT